jgi:hypothetical protein
MNELMQIWLAFRCPYRLTVAYEVSVVLTDSIEGAPAPAVVQAT